jgi:hypothetical protein
MRKVPKLIAQGSVIALMGAAAAVLTTTAASAYVVCNGEGDCWHSDHRYVYPGISVQFYPDSWDWRVHNFRWHDHDGDDRGYWLKDRWVVFTPAPDRDDRDRDDKDHDHDHS